MEQYNNDYEVNEKSIYLVHLDNTRIVIIVTVLLCIITVSFLIGTRFNSMQDGLALDKSETNKASIGSDFGTESTNDDIDKLLNESAESDSLLSSDDPDLMSANDKLIDPVKSENSVPESVEKPIASKSAPAPKKATPVAQKSTATKKKKVVAVSAPAAKPAPVSKPAPTMTKKGFAIQIASFDTKSKAAQESVAINSMNFDSYIDKAMVNGKYYYRVKVGTYTSKQKALSVLQSLHQYPQYGESFLVYEK